MDEITKYTITSTKLLLLGLVIAFFSANSYSANFLIVKPNNKSYYQETVNGFIESLTPKDTYEIELTNNIDNTKKYDAILSIGTQSAIKIINAKLFTDDIVIFSLVLKSTIEPLLSNYPSKKYFVLLIDQPVERQRNIALKFFPQLKTFTLLHTDTNQINNKIEKISSIKVDKPENIFTTIELQLENYDALIATANPKIFSKNNIRNILITSIKKKKPIIGYSKSLVKAGALFTAYTPPYQIGRQSYFIFNNLNDKQTFFYPDTFFIEVNKKILEIFILQVEPGLISDKLYNDSELLP